MICDIFCHTWRPFSILNTFYVFDPSYLATNAGKNEVASSVIKGRRKYVVLWNASVAETNKNGRESRNSKAEEDLRAILESVEKGEIKSRRERDEKIGHIKRKYKVTRYLLQEAVERDLESMVDTRFL